MYIHHFSIRPHRPIWVYVGITTVTTTHRVIYTSVWATTTTRPATNKRQIKETQSTETTNNENRYDYAGHLARSPPPHSSRQHRSKRNLHRRPTSCHSTATTPPPTSAELTTRQHSSNKTTPLRPDSSSSSHHSDSKTAVQTTTMIPTLSSSMN